VKILHINDNYVNLGGAEKYLRETCIALEELGHEIVIITSQNNKPQGIPHKKVYQLQVSSGLRSGLRMKNDIKRVVEHENPDVIHLHNVRYFLSPLIINLLYKLKPVVKFCHDTRLFCLNNGKKVLPTDEICQLPMGALCFIKRCCSRNNEDGINLDLRSNLIKIWELRMTRRLDKIIVSSRYMYDELLRNGFSREKVVVNPLYTERSNSSFSSSRPSGEKMILWVGRFNHPLAIRQKGFTQLIQSLMLMKEKGWRLTVVGGGEHLDEVKKQVSDSKLEDRIDFVGSVLPGDLDTYYQNSTFVVMTSMYPESFGFVGVEAMAFGKPVVAFDVGGVREWLMQEETGFLVERGNVKELARRMDQLLGNAPLARTFGIRGRDMVEKKFRQKKHMENLINIYQDVIENRRRKVA